MSEADAKPEVLMTYDITTDEMRPVTQEDVNRWRDVEQVYGLTRYLLRRVLGYAPAPVPMPDWRAERDLLTDIMRDVDKRCARER